MKKFFQIFLAFHSTFVTIEKVCICILLFTMIFFSFGQVISRNLFGIGFPWIDILLRIEILWLTCIGAALATQFNEHIKIDFINSFLKSDALKKYIEIASYVFAFMISILLFMAAKDFIDSMRGFDNPPCTLVQGIPDWNFDLVIPYCFLTMVIRYPLHIISVIEKGPSVLQDQDLSKV
jgi:TRAP-type C4-dicarboxylate transport system permease small subunit